MTSDTLQKLIRAQPFQPFALRLADGREIPVNHPEVIAHQAGARTAVVMQGDSFEFIDLLPVVSLTTRPAPAEASPGSPA